MDRTCGFESLDNDMVEHMLNRPMQYTSNFGGLESKPIRVGILGIVYELGLPR